MQGRWFDAPSAHIPAAPHRSPMVMAVRPGAVDGLFSRPDGCPRRPRPPHRAGECQRARAWAAGEAGGGGRGVDGQPIRIGGKSTTGFNFLPPVGALPVGLNIASGYELAEFKVQWLVCDFGRRLGRLEQAKLALDVAQLQTDRAFQTVSNEVAIAYYGVLRSQAIRRTPGA